MGHFTLDANSGLLGPGSASLTPDSMLLHLRKTVRKDGRHESEAKTSRCFLLWVIKTPLVLLFQLTHAHAFIIRIGSVLRRDLDPIRSVKSPQRKIKRSADKYYFNELRGLRCCLIPIEGAFYPGQCRWS